MQRSRPVPGPATALVLTLAASCGQAPERLPDRRPTAPAQAAPPAQTAPPQLPPGHVPIEAKPLVFAPPEGWKVVPPTSSMRLAQYELAGEAGAGPAEVAIFSFPGGAGPVEMNFQRWASQLASADGSPATENDRRKETRDGMTFHSIDLSGHYVAETFPGSGERQDIPDYRMVATIIESPDGTFYVKMLGPGATVERWLESYGSFLEGVTRPGS